MEKSNRYRVFSDSTVLLEVTLEFGLIRDGKDDSEQSLFAILLSTFRLSELLRDAFSYPFINSDQE